MDSKRTRTARFNVTILQNFVGSVLSEDLSSFLQIQKMQTYYSIPSTRDVPLLDLCCSAPA